MCAEYHRANRGALAWTLMFAGFGLALLALGRSYLAILQKPIEFFLRNEYMPKRTIGSNQSAINQPA
jgi:hypothetical protein